MSLKDVWKNKVDEVDDVLAKDINDIAHQAIENENSIQNLNTKTQENKGNIEDLSLKTQKNTESIHDLNNNLSSKIEENKEAIDDLGDNLNTKIEENAENIQDLSLKTQKNEASIIQLNTDLIINKEKIAEHESKIENLETLRIIPKVGGSLISLSDSTEKPLQSMKIFGKTKQATTTGKNKLPYVGVTKTTTINGVTFVENGNGTITVNGTATANAQLSFIAISYAFTLKSGETYTLKGCPSSGNTETYRLSVATTDYVEGHHDAGNGVTFTTTDKPYYAYLMVKSGTTVNNLTFYPILVEGSTYDGNWEPYTGGMPSPNPSYPQALESVGESKNLLPYPYLKSGTTVVRGITFTDNGDGSVTVNGTATSNIYYQLVKNLALKPGDYIFSGCPIGGSGTTFGMQIDLNGSPKYIYGTEVAINSNADVSNTSVYIQIMNGTTVNNLTFYPMIRFSNENSLWEPYEGRIEQFVKGKNWFDGFSILKNITFTDGIVSQITADDNPSPLFKLQIINKDNSVINVAINIGLTLGVKTVTFTKDDNSKYLVFGVNGRSRDTTGSVDIRSLPNGMYRWVCNVTNVTQGSFSWTDCMIIPASITDNTYEPYKPSQSLTIPTPNGLPGIPVSSGGNYTDENGQQWICDEVDLERGVLVQRVGEYRNTGVAMSVNTGVLDTTRNIAYWNHNLGLSKCINGYSKIISNCFINNINYATTANVCTAVGFYGNSQYLYFSVPVSVLGDDVTEENIKEKITAWLAKTFSEENPLIVKYQLAEPIETPLSEEEIAAYKALHTNYPNTTIYNDDGAYTEVKYVADTKNYVDNKIANEVVKLTAAIITE